MIVARYLKRKEYQVLETNAPPGPLTEPKKEFAMIEKTLKKITKQLELFAKNGISLLRALDLMEASTQDLEEIVCLNTLRESLSEMADSDKKTKVALAPMRKKMESN